MNTNEEVKQQSDEHGKPVVDFIYLKTNDEAKFHVSWGDKLEEIWGKAYTELKETRLPKDELECQSGTSLMAYLGLRLSELRDQHICTDRKFQIKSETGGA